ncbi:MAG TPA: hypothetical protein VF618_23395 [Thermoanaerobaculia bacterium]
MKHLRIVFFVCLTSATAFAADAHYEGLLARGIAEAQRGEYAQAVKSLRIAAFGTVDDLSQYTTAQVWLAVASQKLGREADARAAAMKLLQAERISATYAALSLDAGTRAAFDAIVKTTPLSTTATPQRQPTAPQRQTAVQPPPAQPPVVVAPRQAASAPATTPAPVETKVTPEPVPASLVKAATPSPAPVAKALAPAPAPVAAKPSATPQPSEVDLKLRDAQRLLNEGKVLAARELYAGLAERRGIARNHLLEIGKGLNRAGAWQESAAVYQRTYPLLVGEEQHMFFEAINRYELGELSIARALLSRALPGLPNSREVMLYRPKIESGQ